MADNNEELKQKIQQLEAQGEKQTQELEALKKQLKENSDNDERRYQELKTLKENKAKWGKIGTFATPLSVLATVITLWLNNRGGKKNDNGESKPKDNPPPKTDLSGIVEIIREVKK